MRNICFLGIGLMGEPMVARLLDAGFSLTLWNRTVEKAQPFSGRARIASSPAEAVAEADVVITNPTHYSVALKYDEVSGGAPRVLAKGVDLVAARIREVAGENDVQIVESPRLARAVYATTDIGSEIPAGLYLAVAQILAYVYQLRDWQAIGGDAPEQPQPQVDDDYLRGHEPQAE